MFWLKSAAAVGVTSCACDVTVVRSSCVVGFRLVTSHVEREVVGAREAAIALCAAERFVAGVFPDVTCQLVGARKLPRARLVRTLVRLLTCNRTFDEIIIQNDILRLIASCLWF